MIFTGATLKQSGIQHELKSMKINIQKIDLQLVGKFENNEF